MAQDKTPTPLSVILRGEEIVDEDSFHQAFARLFGFPSFYGENMNAWIDCMSYLDSPKSEMSQITLMPGQLLLITVQESKLFQQNMPTMFDSLTQCTAVVNRHFADRQSKVRIGLIFE